MDNAKEITAFLDRIEELEDGAEEAVFLFEEAEDEFQEFTLPANLLPDAAGEGEYLTITISRATEKTKAALDEARELRKNLEE